MGDSAAHLFTSSHLRLAAPMHDAFRPSVFAASLPRVAQDGPSARPDECPCAWALDAIDYGAVLLDRDGRLLHSNRQARLRLHAGQSVSLSASGLRFQRAADRARVQAAIDAAAHSGRRQLLCIDAGKDPLDMAVMPVSHDADGGEAVLLLLSRARLCEPLSVEFFARTRGLSGAESRVLEVLCTGARPADIAATLNLQVETVRTHIGRIRAKTGARGMDELLQQIARLPPVLGALSA
jgi:DNA-binding CsgD family transcriptional regulator